MFNVEYTHGTTIMAAVRGFTLPAIVMATAFCMPVAQGADLQALVDAHIDVVSGGIGKEDAAALRAEAHTYPLEVVFARHADSADEFVADVHLSIVDARGRTLVDEPVGPIFLAQLPDGHYVITAQYRGETKVYRVAIAQGQRAKVSFVWS